MVRNRSEWEMIVKAVFMCVCLEGGVFMGGLLCVKRISLWRGRR